MYQYEVMSAFELILFCDILGAGKSTLMVALLRIVELAEEFSSMARIHGRLVWPSFGRTLL